VAGGLHPPTSRGRGLRLRSSTSVGRRADI
jgi:hypothetical protein